MASHDLQEPRVRSECSATACIYVKESGKTLIWLTGFNGRQSAHKRWLPTFSFSKLTAEPGDFRLLIWTIPLRDLLSDLADEIREKMQDHDW